MHARFFQMHPRSRATHLSWSGGTRQLHRWTSIIFTLSVMANFIAMAIGTPPGWLIYAPLLPLFLLLSSGLYLFVLPHAEKWRRRHSTGVVGQE